MSIRDRLETLTRGELTGLVVVIVITLAGAGFWYTRSLPRPVQIAASAAARVPIPGSTETAGLPGDQTASPGVSATPVIVDVTGWVRVPGVYEFAPGDRVIDAVNRAGGARKGADLSAVNLASLLTDGIQIVIPRAGEPGAAGGGATGAGGAPLVNLNTATEQQLETLSGVGPVLANAIVQYRSQHGPFRAVANLLDVSGIGPATLEELRPQVTV